MRFDKFLDGEENNFKVFQKTPKIEDTNSPSVGHFSPVSSTNEQPQQRGAVLQR